MHYIHYKINYALDFAQKTYYIPRDVQTTLTSDEIDTGFRLSASCHCYNVAGYWRMATHFDVKEICLTFFSSFICCSARNCKILIMTISLSSKCHTLKL